MHCGDQFNIPAENFTPYCTTEIYILLGNDVLIFYREDEGQPIGYKIVRTGGRIHPALIYPIKVEGERKETYQVHIFSYKPWVLMANLHSQIQIPILILITIPFL